MKWQNSCITTYSIQLTGVSISRLFSVITPLYGWQEPHLDVMRRILTAGYPTPTRKHCLCTCRQISSYNSH